jgi:hypothetical protein
MAKKQAAPAKKAEAKKAAPRYADAAGVATSGQTSIGPAIEKAMSDAIVKATAAGVSDPDEIKKRMMAARQAVVDAAAKEAEAEAKRQKALVEGK